MSAKLWLGALRQSGSPYQAWDEPKFEIPAAEIGRSTQLRTLVQSRLDPAVYTSNFWNECSYRKELSMPRNRQILLRSRPAGMPSLENFEMIERPMPEPKEEEVLTRTLFLSLDPYMRGRMSDAKSYATPVALGNVMEGQTIGQVVVSRHSGLAAGDLVLGQGNWQEYASIPGKTLRKLDPALTPGATALGVLGMPGLTAYVGLLDIGQPRPGETVVVSAASGAVGSTVGQIAKIKGCRVVGIAGGSAKCRYIVDELGFEAAIDHRSPEFGESLTRACPDGVDIYFENVGGAVQRAVW